MSRESDFITLARQAARDLVAALNKINSLNREYGSRGGSAWLEQTDFSGENALITKADFDTAFGNLVALDTYATNQFYDDTYYKVV